MPDRERNLIVLLALATSDHEDVFEEKGAVGISKGH